MLAAGTEFKHGRVTLRTISGMDFEIVTYAMPLTESRDEARASILDDFEIALAAYMDAVEDDYRRNPESYPADAHRPAPPPAARRDQRGW